MGTKNTDLVANFEATPQVKNNAAELHGVLRTAHGTVELASGDSDNDDIVMLAPIPSNAAVPSLFVGSDTFGGSCFSCFLTSALSAGARSSIVFKS